MGSYMPVQALKKLLKSSITDSSAGKKRNRKRTMTKKLEKILNGKLICEQFTWYFRVCCNENLKKNEKMKKSKSIKVYACGLPGVICKNIHLCKGVSA